MIISFQGLESFKISQGDLALAVNPKAKTSADVVLTTTSTFESESENKNSFPVFGPGEYEIKGIGIKGFLSEAAEGKVNTIYMINFEGMNLCFLGALSNGNLPTATLEAIDDIDILFLPIGGEGVLDAEAANKLAVALEPRIIIPMHYTSPKALEKFLKEAGEEKVAPLDKLVVKKKDLEGKEAEVVILKEE